MLILVFGKCSIIIITRAFIYCRNAVDLPCDSFLATKDQPRYSSVTKFKYDPILGGNNDYLIINFIENFIDKEDCESVQKLF